MLRIPRALQRRAHVRRQLGIEQPDHQRQDRAASRRAISAMSTLPASSPDASTSAAAPSSAAAVSADGILRSAAPTVAPPARSRSSIAAPSRLAPETRIRAPPHHPRVFTSTSGRVS